MIMKGDEKFEDFVAKVSKLNSDYTEDPKESWRNSPDIEPKRKLRDSKRKDAAELKCKELFF